MLGFLFCWFSFRLFVVKVFERVNFLLLAGLKYRAIQEGVNQWGRNLIKIQKRVPEMFANTKESESVNEKRNTTLLITDHYPWELWRSIYLKDGNDVLLFKDIYIKWPRQYKSRL